MFQWAIQFLSYFQKELKYFGLVFPSENLKLIFAHKIKKIKNKKKKQKKVKARSFAQEFKQSAEKSSNIHSSTKQQVSQFISSQDRLFESKDINHDIFQISDKQHNIPSRQYRYPLQIIQEQIIKQQDVKKASFNKQKIQLGVVLYQKQFQELMKIINEMIIKIINDNQHRLESSEGNLSLHRDIFIVGASQSGKKHLINQVLSQVLNKWNRTEINDQDWKMESLSHQKSKKMNLKIQKQFLTEISLNQYAEWDHDLCKMQKAVIDSQDHGMYVDVLMRVNIISSLSAEHYKKSAEQYKKSAEQYKKSAEQYKKNQLCCNQKTINKITRSLVILINCFCISQDEFSQKYQKLNPSYQIDNSNLNQEFFEKFVNLPSMSSLTPQPITLQLTEKLKQILLSYIKCLQLQLEQPISYKETVIIFIIKYIIKRYQAGKKNGSHPVIVLKFLQNYLKDYFINEIKNSQNNNISLELSSKIITQFFKDVLSFNQSPCCQISLATLTLGHQLVFISCYLYLKHPRFCDALFINSKQLFGFFTIVQQSLMMGSQFPESSYWSFLQKLKEMKLIEFCQDRKGEKSRAGHRSSRKIKFVRDYKNKNFLLCFQLQKIICDLEQFQIYRKFFQSDS